MGMQGWKTITATILYALTEGCKVMWPAYEPAITSVQNILIIPLGVFGIGHKLDKAVIRF